MKTVNLLLLPVALLLSCDSPERGPMMKIGQAIENIKKGDYKPAAASLDSVIAGNPQYPLNVLAHQMRGQARQAMADSAGACEDWRQAVILDEENANSEARELYKKFCE